MTLLKILAIGWLILLSAIILNWFAHKLGMSTWYGYLNSIQDSGLSNTHQNMSVFNLAFLYLIYPFLLGATAYSSYRGLF